jgi:hypothetical protein
LKLLVHLVGVATTAVVAVGGGAFVAVGGGAVVAVGGGAVVAVGGGAVVAVGGGAVVPVAAAGVTGVFVAVRAGVSVGVSAGVSVDAFPLTSITTSTISPKVMPESSAKRQLPVYVPAVSGAVNVTDTFPCPPGETEPLTVPFPPLIELPLKNRMVKPVSQVQEPVFWSVHVLTKVWPGLITVPSGMVASAT